MNEKTIKKLEKLQEIIIMVLLIIWLFIPVLKEIRITCRIFDYEYMYIKIVGGFGIALLILNICRRLFQKENQKDLEKELLPISILGIFLIWTFISCIFSSNIQNSLYGTDCRKDGFISYLAYGGFLACTYLLKSEKLKKLLINIFVGASILNIIIVKLYSLGIGTGIFAVRELTRTCFFNSNHYGYYLLLATTSANFLFVTENKKFIRVIYLLEYIFLLYYLVFNNTLGCYVALAITLVIFLIYTLISKKKRIVAIISILIFALISLGVQETKNIAMKNMKSIVTDVNNVLVATNDKNDKKESKDKLVQVADRAGSGRIKIWKYGIKFFFERPILGYGPENLEIKYKEVGIEQDRPHNLIIQLATTSGIVGLIAYLVAIGMILIRAFKCMDIENRNHMIAFACVIAYLVSAMFGNSMYYTSPYFFIFLGFLIVKSTYSSKKEKKIEK